MCHELCPDVGHGEYAGSSLLRATREAVAGDGRCDDCERIGGVAAMRRRVGEQRDNFEHLDEASGPTVSEHQGDRSWSLTTLMDVVDSVLVDLRYKLGKRIQARFVRPPIILLQPMLNEALHVGYRWTVVPRFGCYLIGPDCPLQA